MKDSNNYLTSLINTGADAMTNLYCVTFTDSSASDTLRQGMTIRLKNFTPPTFTRLSAPVHYQTAFHDQPLAGYSGNRQFQLVFRLDEYYDVYKYLLNKKGKIVNPSTSYAGGDVDNGMTIEVKAYIESTDNEIGDTAAYEKMWKYEYCWVQEVKLSQLAYTTNAPMTVTATINFWKWQDPEDLR